MNSISNQAQKPAQLSSPNKGSFKNILSRNLSKVFYSGIAVILYLGWLNRESSNLTAESGLGYMLGIIGGSLMLLLLLYPVRKKFRIFQTLGLVKHWFKMHMLFGVLGPVSIMFHANFSLGSVNSNVALFSMIIVASSGLVGRYLYAKIHHGLYGRKSSLAELRENLNLSKGKLGERFSLSKNIANTIKSTERKLLKNRNIVLATLTWPFIFLYAYRSKVKIHNELRKTFRKSANEKDWDNTITRQLTHQAFSDIENYINNIYALYGFRVFESLFSLWHILHLPLFIMLVLTGILHVVVVHSY